jgi:hypothetical protein
MARRNGYQQSGIFQANRDCLPASVVCDKICRAVKQKTRRTGFFALFFLEFSNYFLSDLLKLFLGQLQLIAEVQHICF